MARIEQSVLTRTITADAQAHPHDLASNLARRHAVTRATILRHLKRLVELGWLEREAGGSARFKPGPQREVNLQYPTAGLDEHTPWVRDVQPMLALAPAAARLAQHVFGEILNNAVDHGEATTVNVSIRQTPSHLHLLISDDGVGVFDQLARRAGLADVQRAALELAKGRLTTQPAAHGGRGLFFVARMVEAMNVQSNGQVLQWRDRGASVRLLAHPLERPGTTVFVSLRLDTDVRTSDAYGAYGSAQAPLDFSRTQVPLRLLTDAGHALDSRAQARWVVSRLELFATAELDFD
ncbi:MAG TPA: ATP-binding protein, partial [Burkholderiaceae bacterium]|nr:ATP-binding protein [Burkholderiaceae bacterium]